MTHLCSSGVFLCLLELFLPFREFHVFNVRLRTLCLTFNAFLIYHASLHYIYSISLDNDVLETLKRRAMFCNILSQIFIVSCFKLHSKSFDYLYK